MAARFSLFVQQQTTQKKPKLQTKICNYSFSLKVPIRFLIVGSVVKWFSAGILFSMVSVQNPLTPFCCVLGKDTLRHISLEDWCWAIPFVHAQMGLAPSPNCECGATEQIADYVLIVYSIH